MTEQPTSMKASVCMSAHGMSVMRAAMRTPSAASHMHLRSLEERFWMPDGPTNTNSTLTVRFV